MNTTEDLITTGCAAIAPQPINKVIKPIEFPAQPQEWKIVSLRECPTRENIHQNHSRSHPSGTVFEVGSPRAYLCRTPQPRQSSYAWLFSLSRVSASEYSEADPCLHRREVVSPIAMST